MSRPARGKVLLVLAFVLTLGAGIVVGIGLSNQGVAGTTVAPVIDKDKPRPPSPDSWIKNKLDLTPEQSEQMREVWSSAMEGPGKELSERRRSLYRERDAAIEALYTPEQRAERKRLQEQFDVKIAENRKENEKIVQGAVEKTKALLTEPQRKIYEEILRERSQRDRDRDRHRGGPSSRPSTRPSDRSPPPFGGPPGGRQEGRRGGGDGESKKPEGREADSKSELEGRR